MGLVGDGPPRLREFTALNISMNNLDFQQRPKKSIIDTTKIEL